MRPDEPESEQRLGGAVETEEAAPADALTQVELEVELRQSIGRQLHEVLTRPSAEREAPKAEKSRGE